MNVNPHPEDIKAAIRKRHKSIAQFERTKALPSRSVKDVLSGKSRRRIAIVIADDLGIELHALFPGRFVSPIGDVSKLDEATHRLNSKAA
jgi:lambda repressor-like predicted transcriptional regulator